MSEFVVTHDLANQRFNGFADGTLVGFVDYSVTEGEFDLYHTEVFPQFGGQGYGSMLVRQTLDQIHAMEGETVIPTCPFVARFIDRHPDYAVLIGER